MTRPARILVAGAGPAGLTLALQAAAHGASVRIIDRRPAAFRPSRALILHARTLEVLRPLGVAEPLLDRADVAPRVELRLGPRAIRVQLGDLALRGTAFPHLSLIRQADVERALTQALADRGIEVERGTELISALDAPEAARAVVRSPTGTDQAVADFIGGCDGPASIVRAQARISWRGGPYATEIVLADAELAGADPGAGAVVMAGRRGLVFAFPLGEQAAWRLLGTRPARAGDLPFGQPGPPVPAAELQAMLDEAGLGVGITSLAWSARLRVQHRLAGRFSRGRLYLAGDAAHAYSPATGQGMNAAIQDAANLGWKLAFATSSLPGGELLDSYDRERRPVARHVLALTHLAFWAEAATGPMPSLLRGDLAPLAAPVVPVLLSRRRLVAAAVRLVSQLGVSYRSSPLSAEGDPRPRGGPRAGDRLPDQPVSCSGRQVELHDLTARPGIHVLLDRNAEAVDETWPSGLVSVHRLTSRPGRGLMVIRPDGYIGLRCQVAGRRQLAQWLRRVGITPA